MSRKLAIETLAGVILFFAVSMSVMLVRACDRVVVVADVAQDQIDGGEGGGESRGGDAGKQKLLRFQKGAENTNYLCIPLEPGVKAAEVKIENHYMDRELWITIQGGTDDFYASEPVTGNIRGVKGGTYDAAEGRALLKFRLEDIYEYRNVLEENTLYIEFVPPREIYDRIVVVDPAGGGADAGISAEGLREKDVALDIVKRLKTRLDETDIKVYYTRMEDKDPSPEERIGLANSVKADMFISVGLNGDAQDDKKYGTEAVYNENFFIPGFGSVELADLVEREVVTAISGKGNGLVAAGSGDGVVWDATVPATALRVGYLTNRQEAVLLGREDYRERIAEGLYGAILKAYESYE